MAELTVDITYGKALFEAAGEVGKTDIIMREAEELSEILKGEKELFDFLCIPTISASEKKDVIKKIFEGSIETELLNLLYVLIDKGRCSHFERIIRQYRKNMNESHGFTTGVIYSVLPLSAEQLVSFEEKTGKLLNKKVKLENRTDRNIIGGVRIFVEGKVIDATVKKRLSDLKDKLQ